MTTEMQKLALQDSSLLTGKAYINGQWRNAESEEVLDVLNPANGLQIGTVACCGVRETRQAIEAAELAREDWQNKTAKERGTYLRRMHELLLENQEDLARILTAEQGKPLAESRGEIAYCASYFEWFAEEGKRLYGDTIPAPATSKRILVTKQGIGVVACITPWNFPSAMLGRKIAPALAAGCTVVCKPAELTPFSANAIAVLAERAGIPKGVINIVSGYARDIGQELTQNTSVRKLSFTGSTAVGKLLIKQCADTVKRTSMELGGNAPFIVFEDADIDQAVDGAIASKFRNAGQTCVCTNRILLHEKISEQFIDKFVSKVSRLQLGDGFEENVTIGPLINGRAVNAMGELVSDATAQGASILCGGSKQEGSGNFYSPTVLNNVTCNMRVFKEEIFGPIAPISVFSSEKQAIAMANKSEAGLAGYFYTKDINRMFRVSEALECGIIGINDGIISTEVAPFGGVKESGNGREGSKYGLDDYTEIKYMCIGGLNN